jgi:two-component system response regulator RegX3
MITFDEKTSTVIVDDRRNEAVLTPLEGKLVQTLIDRQGEIVSKYQLVESVWGEDYIEKVDDSRIEKLVSRVRAKIEPNPNSPKYILLVRGLGYRVGDPIEHATADMDQNEVELLRLFGKMSETERDLLLRTARSWVQ